MQPIHEIKSIMVIGKKNEFRVHRLLVAQNTGPSAQTTYVMNVNPMSLMTVCDTHQRLSTSYKETKT